MENDVLDFFRSFMKATPKINREIPDTARQFMGLADKALAPGALDKKQKELIALGIAVAQHCTPCIYLHVQKAVEAGAARKEIMEAAGVAVLMGGGPAFTHIEEVLKALEALSVP